MTGSMLELSGLYMPRHFHDIIPPKQLSEGTLSRIENIAQDKFDLAGRRYPSSQEERWEEMDRYWAGEHALFILYQQPYINFLPGKFFTYRILTNLLEENLGTKNMRLKGAKIAEIGCGSALWSLMLAQHGAEVYLFDKSYCGLEYSKFLAEAPYFGVKLKCEDQIRQGDFYDLPPEWERKFDVAIGGGVLEHLSIHDQNKYLQGILRILRPGGVIAFTMLNPQSPLNISSDLRRKEFYESLKTFKKLKYILPFPMPYNEEGGTRSTDEMLTTNGFEVIESNDAVFLAPSGPLEANLVKGSKVAEKLYRDLESMCVGKLVNPNEDGEERVMALIRFWDRMGESITQKGRREIGRWLYAIGRKPRS